MAGQKLAANDLTIDWLVHSLKNSGTEQCKTANLKDWKDGLIAVGDGFGSHIIRVELAWEGTDSGLPSVVVIKVYPYVHKLFHACWKLPDAWR